MNHCHQLVVGVLIAITFSACSFVPEENGSMNEEFLLEQYGAIGQADSGGNSSDGTHYFNNNGYENGYETSHETGMDFSLCCPMPDSEPCVTEKACYCLCEGYEPCYRTVAKCIEEKIPCKKQCCRYVDKLYEVPRCRLVPEHYTETICKTELEYFEVDDYKINKRWVYEQECTLVPKYYWKEASECSPRECSSAEFPPPCT